MREQKLKAFLELGFGPRVQAPLDEGRGGVAPTAPRRVARVREALDARHPSEGVRHVVVFWPRCPPGVAAEPAPGHGCVGLLVELVQLEQVVQLR